LILGLARGGRAPRPLALSLITACLLSVCVLPRTARAGGLYLMPRGVEAASRGGARVAGSDDPQALWYNPAGLLSSGRQLLVDGLLPIVRSDFTRVLDNGMVEPTVSSTSSIPIPTIAYSDNFGLKRWGFGIGLLIPPAWGGEWPAEVDGQPAPTRYSALPGPGAFYGTLALGAAYSPVDRLSLGAALYVSVAQIGGTVAISACDYAICLQPEAPEWEGRTSFLLGPMVTATAVFGATYAFDYVKLGTSLQLRTKIDGEGSFDVALPDQAVFDDIVIENADGSDDLRAHTEAELPMIIRVGVEVQPIKPLKIELAGSWENWSNLKSVTVDPINVWLRNVPGIGDAEADSVTLARNAQDTWAAHLGANYDLAQLFNLRNALFANAGFMFESSSVRERDLDVSTLDTRKVLLGLGVSVAVSRSVLLDITYGHIFMKNHTVTNSDVLLPGAVKPLPEDDDPNTYDAGDRPAIGNGRYEMEGDYVGLGVRWKLDPLQRGAKTQPAAASSGAAASKKSAGTQQPVAAAEPAAAPEPIIVPLRPPPAEPAAADPAPLPAAPAAADAAQPAPEGSTLAP
jgi:long-subunit fatty acid transport protein